MNRRAFLATIAATSIPAAARKPDIILILADDLGAADLSSFGSPDIHSPNIDSIARRGIRFTQCYANGPECSPTRSALLTGRYQHRFGGLECAIGNGNIGRYDEAAWLAARGELGLPATEISLPRILKQNGYDTACFGKWHLGYLDKFLPRRHGFDQYFGILGGGADYFTHKEENGNMTLYRNEKPEDRKGYLTDLFADEAIAWLKRRTEKPFFLYVPFNAPHVPIQDPDGFDAKLGTAPTLKLTRPVYVKMVERMDKRIGGILRQLRDMGRDGNTIVIFLSDNGGDPNGDNGTLRGRKSSTWEGGIRVPGMMQWPGKIPAGKVTPQVTLSMDLMPTLLSAAGIKPPAGTKFDGIDLMPVLTGVKSPISRTVFWRGRRAENIRKAVRDGSWKLVDDNGKQELHDLSTDEIEQKDLLHAQPERAALLRRKLADWERDVRAPRLAGFRPGAG